MRGGNRVGPRKWRSVSIPDIVSARRLGSDSLSPASCSRVAEAWLGGPVPKVPSEATTAQPSLVSPLPLLEAAASPRSPGSSQRERA